jgi:hypothetical protein
MQIFITVQCLEASDFNINDIPKKNGGALFIS